MTRRLTTVMALAVALLLPSLAHGQANPRYWFQVRGDDGSAITSARCRILTAGTNTEPTIYTTTSLATAAVNPLTASTSTGECEWYAAPNTTYDAIVFVTGGPYKGARVRVDAVTQNLHVVPVSRSHSLKVLVKPWQTTDNSTSAQAAGNIPAGALIRNVLVETKTAVAASTFNVSINTPSGATHENLFCSAIDTSAVGWVNCAPSAYLATIERGVTFHNQNHASAGYVYVFYYDLSNEP